MNTVEWAGISFDLPPELSSLPQEVGSYGFPTLNTPRFAQSRNPRLYLSIATTATTFFFRMGYPILFWVAIQPFRAAYHPYPYPHCLPTSCIPIPSNPVANKHSWPFLFSESPISLSKIQGTFLYMYFLKIPIFLFFSRSGIRNPVLTPHPEFLALTNSTPTLVCPLSLLTSTFPSSYLFYHSYPVLPIFPLKITLNPLNRRRKYICSTFSREFKRVPQQSGVRYLEESQQKWKVETCSVKRDPFTFIW